jgi:hypothetical protein|tara:strand:+ start:8679 stop:9548 length:870 start_codon:yes stop_codon:yes gene_type:complete
MANGGIIGPANDPVQEKNVTSFTSTTPGGHTFHPATNAIDYLVVAGSGGRNPTGIGNSGSGAGGLLVSESNFATPVTPGGTTGAITIGGGGGTGSQGSPSSIAPGGGLGSISTTGGGQGKARGQTGAPGGSGSGGGDGHPNNTTSGGGSVCGQGNPGGPGGPGEPSGGGGGYGGAGGAPGGHPQYGPGPGYSSDIASPASAPVTLQYAVGGNGEGAPSCSSFGNNPAWIDAGSPTSGTGRDNSGMGTLYGNSSDGIVIISENGNRPVTASGVWTMQEQFTQKKTGVWTS